MKDKHISFTVSNSTGLTSDRIVGYDFARSMALLGMVIVNYKIVMIDTGPHPEWLLWIVERIEGRAAAMFVMLAGIGITLMSQYKIKNNCGTATTEIRYNLWNRAFFLLVAGLINIHFWHADILHFYAAYLFIGAWYLTSSPRHLWQTAGMAVLTAFIFNLVFYYYNDMGAEDLLLCSLVAPLNIINHLFFNGFYPVFPWIAFLLVGMWLGRQNIKNRTFQIKAVAWGVAVTCITENLSKTLIPLFFDYDNSKIVYYVLDTGAWPSMPLYMLSAGGTAIAAITICVMLAEKMNQNWLKPFTAVGRMSLTLYVIHVTIGIEGLDYMGLYMDSQSLWVPISVAIGFYVFSIGFANLWEKAFGRGPLETLMRKIRLLKKKMQVDNDIIIVQNDLESQRLFCFRRYVHLKKEKTNKKKNQSAESKAA